jgi:hypothetical protein
MKVLDLLRAVLDGKAPLAAIESELEIPESAREVRQERAGDRRHRSVRRGQRPRERDAEPVDGASFPSSPAA